MDLFDTATTEMKRLRNQKKDGTILQRMEMSSSVVEPTELIFGANGEFRRARDIFDDSEDSGSVSHTIFPLWLHVYSALLRVMSGRETHQCLQSVQ